MMSSRSIPSKLLVVFAVLFLWIGRADADRKRVVVLDFEGPNAEKFHADVVKLIKKNHTVVKATKWNKAAEELDAAKVTEKNVKKVAKKLKIDGVITGKIDKRRDEYIIKLKLRAGTTGELVGNSVSTKADGPRLEGQAQRDIKDELVAVIDELESNREGGGDEGDEDSPKKKKDKGEEATDDEPKKSGFSRKGGDDDEGDKPKKKKGDDEEKKGGDETAETDMTGESEEDKPKKKRSKSSDEDEDRPRKRKASSEEDESVEASAEEPEAGDKVLWLSPGRRAVDAVVGLSFTARNLKFTYANDLGDPPPGYKQGLPVGGALLDVTFYPMSLNHNKPPTIVSGIGINVLYDQVLKINSQKRYSDAMNNPQIANLDTKESRWTIAGVFRYPIGKGANAPVVGGSLAYNKQKFTVAQTLPNNEPTDIPNVGYSMISPGIFVRFPVIPKLTANLDAAFHAITDTGAIQTRTQYGAATVSGYSLILGADYAIMPNIFVRAAMRYQKIGFTFKGDPMSQTNTRDTDPEQDVTGASDSYFGGVATVGYVY
jgi:opacity protein-like surface antigen